MVQSLNLPAIGFFFGSIVRNPRLVIPHLDIPSIAQLHFARMREAGVQAIVFDKDNTLTAPYARHVHPSVELALAECLQEFGRDHVVVFSNSAGSADDTDFAHAAALERDLGVPVLKHGTKKPGGAHAIRAALRVGTLAHVALIGDRYLTDVAFGNRVGMLTIRTAPFTAAGDNPAAKLIRPLERRAADWLRSRGVQPPAHPLASSAPCWVR